ncbi:MAG: SpoIIE family protein phosphatase [Candidatus Brocadiia bacterium]
MEGSGKHNLPKTGQSGVMKSAKSTGGTSAVIKKTGTGKISSSKMPTAKQPAAPEPEHTQHVFGMKPTGMSLAIKYTLYTSIITAIAILILVFMAKSSVESAMETEINKAGIRLIKALSVMDIDYWINKSKEVEKNGEGYNPLVSFDSNSKLRDKVGAKEPTIMNIAITKEPEGYHLLSIRGKGDKLSMSNAKSIFNVSEENIDITEGLYREAKTGVEVRTRLFVKNIIDREGLRGGKIYLFLSAKEIDETMSRVLAGFLFPAILTIIIGGLLGYFMAKQVTRPVKTLMEDMKVVSEGELGHQSTVKTDDEVGVLAKVFNQMTLSLATAHQKEMETKAIERELSIAREIQYNLLPKEIPVVPDYDIGAHYKPCYEVSGDYYDLIRIDDDNIGVVVADVSGKGVPASMIMTMTRSLIRMESEHNMSPAGVLSKVNRILAKDIRRGMFVTALYYIINTKTGIVTMSSAGHNPMLVWRFDEKKYELVNPNGIALGFDRGAVFDRTIKEMTVKLGVYDRVVTYTDGVTESMNEADEEFGGQRFFELTGQLAQYSSSRYIESVINNLEQFKGSAPQHDDITIVSIKRII